jgi:hypothetical protein
MLALAKFWTWVGHLFIPFAIGWSVYVRGGLTSAPPPTGVLVSRSYWGLLITLAVGTALIWALALYVREAKRKRASILVPPNTTFEEDERNQLISWGTIIAFILATALSLIIFGVRYSESVIYRWDDQQPIHDSFFSSRAGAHALGCAKQPCFAVEKRIDASSNPVHGVNEYILYLTDGGLLVVSLGLIAGVGFLANTILRDSPKAP